MEISEIKEKFGDNRRTEIVYAAEEFDMEDLIAEEDMVVTISRSGYIKRMPPRAYRVQNRGGRGVTAGAAGAALGPGTAGERRVLSQ